MEPTSLPQQVLSDKSQKRASFSPIKAIRSLSISSQISHLSIGSDTEIPSSGSSQRKTLRKTAPAGPLRKGSLIRNDSKSSSDGSVGRASTSTQPTTPSVISRSASIHGGDPGSLIKSGPLQPESSILKSRKEYLVLTSSALLKFKNRAAAENQFPIISAPDQGLSPLTPLTPVGSYPSLKDLSCTAEVTVPLDKVVSVFKDEGTRPSFGLEIWWKSSQMTHVFASLEIDFHLPDERDDWLRHIRHAVIARARALGEARAPSDIEASFTSILDANNENDSLVDLYPVIPRRPYTKLPQGGEPKKNWRESSSFYLAFTKYSLLMAQFSGSPNGQKIVASHSRFGVVTLSRVRVNISDERFDLVFRLPLGPLHTVELSSRYHQNILNKLFKADTYLKPAWPLWTRREVFYVNDDTQQIPLPNGEDYGGFKTTLEAFIEGYQCQPVQWTVKWKGVPHAPQFCLLKAKKQSQYSAHQLLAVFRALRFNEFFKSISFHDIDFSLLWNKFDNTQRLESTIWLSRTGKRSLTRSEVDRVEHSSVLFQELVSILLGSESIKSLDLTNVLRRIPTRPPLQVGSSSSVQAGVCEIIPPIVLLWASLQTRCNSIKLNGNAVGQIDAVELCRVLQSRPNFLRSFGVSRCNLDEASLVYLWEGLHEQRSSLHELDTSYNPGRIEASRVASTLNEASGLRRLNLAYTIRGELEGPLFRPWTSATFEAWRLEELDLSGWKLNFETLCGIMKYLELDESHNLSRLSLQNCAVTGELATGLFCRIGAGRDMHLLLNGNPLEVGSTDWIDLIHAGEAPTKLHLDMIQFQHESTFNSLLTALTHNKTIKFLSMVGTSPPSRVTSKTSDLLSNFFRKNTTLQFLDLSGYSGKLEDGHLGWGLSSALDSLNENTSLRQLRLRNHDIGSAEDLTGLHRFLMANTGLTMLDILHNNFDHRQFGELVQALSHNHQLISFPLSQLDREYAISKERRLFTNMQWKSTTRVPDKLSKSAETRLDGVLKRLHTDWESEAEKVASILERNRASLMNLNETLELESEYLEVWDDEDLPAWLWPPSKPYQDNTRRRASESSIISAEEISSSLLASIPYISHQDSYPSHQTYVIEEET
ncbi:hypothetical protein F5B22DRAFT_166229 [Xylaria bambusicola]|uniref:uncharacterized protein n=1 Tax=Xylaria bambusicola TaxID=326684 RepID=UPI0020074D1C|nr:uncharacterized protein F5B22DRAFT_166229 [Xylaria bambusicola]KAI0526574.1 hypothetical protein F5B22DRAFT_166229 [Xylaria bambusicola]